MRLEADSNYTRIYLLDSQVSVTAKTLKEYEKLLCNEKERFMRVHQSHIINLEHASRYLKEENLIIMKDESRVPLAKSKRLEFLKWLGL
jgi:two-component system LytT family response regulator